MKNKQNLTLTLLIACLVLCVTAIVLAFVIKDNNSEKDGGETTVNQEEITGDIGDIDIDINDLF